MKIRRYISMFFALCMTLALAVPAGAVNVSEDAALSEHAGSTIQCQVVKSSDSGEPVSSIVDIYVPEGTTKAQENSVIRSALFARNLSKGAVQAQDSSAIRSALSAAGNSASLHKTNEVLDLVGTRNNLSLYPGWYTEVCSGTIPGPNYITLVVQFSDLSNFHGTQKLSVTVTGGQYPNRSHTMTCDFNPSLSFVWMYTGADRIFLTDGNTITATAKTDQGFLSVGKCDILASIYDLAG